MSDVTIGLAELRQRFVLAGHRVSAARDELCRLDAIAGDGDLGVTLAAGFAHVERALDGTELADAGALLKTVGTQLARNAPSTIGALLGSAFMRVARDFEGADELNGDQIAAFLEAIAVKVGEQGGAKPGERTVLDAMTQAALEARQAATDGLDACEVLRCGSAGAARGASATADMEAVHGRAGWIAERARGEQDGGAVAWSLYLAGLADSDESVTTAGALQIDEKEGDS